MSGEHGSFSVSRKAFRPVEKGGDVLWNKPRVFSEWEAWEYLFARAAFKPHSKALRKGGVVELQRGETPPLAVRYLATKWKWSPNKVHKFIKTLATKLARVQHCQRTADGDTYLIVNYDVYQPVGYSKKNSQGTQTKQLGDEREERLPTTTPTAGAEEKTIDNAAQARVEMWAEFDRRAGSLDEPERSRAQSVVRGIITGDTNTAWLDPTGMPVPWEERPRLFRLALDERTANGGKLHVVLRQVVIPREFDPFPQTKSTDRKPKPGSEAANVRSEYPGAYRAPASTAGLEPINGPKPEPSKPMPDVREKIAAAWALEHPEENERLLARLASQFGGQGKTAETRIRAEYLAAVMLKANGQADAA